MARATYAELGDGCATAHAMELIGARWTYPILRELMLGPKRFTALLEDVRGITPAVLTARLRELAELGLVEPARDDGARGLPYALTGWARELGPILRELGRWAQASPSLPAAGGLTPDASVQAMLTLGERVAAPRALRVQLVLVDARVPGGAPRPYRVRWTRRGVRADPGIARRADATVHGDSSAWASVLFGQLAPAASGLRVSGDTGRVAAFVDTLRAAAG